MVQGSPLRKKIFPSEFSGEIVSSHLRFVTVTQQQEGYV